MAGLGLEVGAQAMGGALLGWLYDQWQGSGNIGVIVGAGVGIVTGLLSLVRGGLKLNRQLDETARRDKQRGQAPPSSPTAISGDEQSESDDDVWHDWNDNDDNWNAADDAGQGRR